MRSPAWFRTFTWLLIAVFLQGCGETQESTTRVNPDGTIVRSERISPADSLAGLQTGFPPWVDSTWNIQFVRTEGRALSKTATKVFSSVEEMNRIFRGEKGTALAFRGDLEKRFRWFFTDFVYRETCLEWNPFDQVPITDYVTRSEIDLWFRYELFRSDQQQKPFATRGDSLALRDAQDRGSEWQMRSMFESYFAAFVKGVKSLNDPSLPPTSVLKQKEKLYALSRPLFEHSPNNLEPVHALFARTLGSIPARRAIELGKAGFELHAKKIEFLERMITSEGVVANIEMPGLVIDTNAPSLKGNTATWEDIRWRTYLGDFEMRVHSRMINWWAVVVTGILLAVAVSFTIAGMVRRRRFA